MASPVPATLTSVVGVALIVTGLAAVWTSTGAAPTSLAVTQGDRVVSAPSASRLTTAPTRRSAILAAAPRSAPVWAAAADSVAAAGPVNALERVKAAVLPSLWAIPAVLLTAAFAAQRVAPKRVALASTTGEATAPVGTDGEYVFATLLSEIPKGTRKLVTLRGANILIFWYRNELFAIENRSPAEGAFNQGFEQARFTQDCGILCPSTETEFNLKTGEVVNWMPNNSVLRFLTPPCAPLDVFPVKVEGDEVKVKVAAEERVYFDGGARSSFERNNVFGIEPRMYLDDGTYIDDAGVTQKSAANPTTIIITTIAVAIVAVAGTATCLYFESIPALVVFWLVGFAITAKVVLDYTEQSGADKP